MIQSGLTKFGPRIAQKLARASLGDELLQAAINLPDSELEVFLSSWRQDLRKELSKCHLRSLVNAVPADFPSLEHLRFFALPLTSFSAGSAGPDLSLL